MYLGEKGNTFKYSSSIVTDNGKVEEDMITESGWEKQQ